MKKLTTLLLMVLSSVMVLSACGQSSAGTGAASPSPVASQAASPAASAPAKNDVKAALLISGNLGDMSFNDSAQSGVVRAQEEYGITVKTIECNSDVSKFEPTLIEAAEEGNNIVLVGSNFKEYIEMYADEYPDTTFIIFDETVDWDKGEFKNVYSIIYKNNEGSFLGGYMAAKLSKSGIIGFLGGMDIPTINDFLIGYVEGAQYANPDVKVATTYSNSFSDSAKGKELSLAMISQGADISFNVAGGAGIGLIEASVEKGTKVVGVDSDQALKYKDTKPEFAQAIPSSVLKNVGFTLYRAIGAYLDGTLPVGQSEHLGIAEGAMGLADNEFFRAQVPEDVIKELAELEKKVTSGEITISSAYGLDGSVIVELRNKVNP